ncbi:MAG: PilZ domain-containing protein [Candidatus Omnitrophota bacterium]
MTSGIERRKYPRFPVHYSVLCTAIEKKFIKLRTTAENASRTGLKILFSGDKIVPKDQLKLEVVKSIAAKPITCYGTVVWTKESPLVYGERSAGIHLTKIAWTESSKLTTNIDI